VNAFHHGGRWEPQFNLGWLTPPHAQRCLRIGVGFNLSQSGRDAAAVAEQEQILRYFERFQRTIEKSWQRELARWMAGNGGFIQCGNLPPALDMLPDRAIERILSCRDAVAVGWVFIGRWLFLDKPDEAKILGDRSKLATAVDDTFRSLYPLWLTTYAESTSA
jgi:hypothetical protein